MDRVAELKAAGRSPVAIYHAFRLQYWSGTSDLICCFEGNEDLPFYLPHIRAYLDNKLLRVFPIICKGKNNLFEVIKKANRDRINFDRAWFFCDRDFDDFLGNKRPRCKSLFVTCFYSIESYLVDPKVFEAIWTDCCHLDFADPRFKVWSDSVQESIQTFVRTISPLMAAAISLKAIGANIDFDDIRISEAFAFDSSGCIERRTRRWRLHLTRDFAAAVIGNNVLDLRPILKMFKTADSKKWCRGKYLLWAFTKILERMKADLGKKGALPKRAVIKTSFSDETAVEVLSARCPIPEKLAKFLTTRVRAFKRVASIPLESPS